MDEVLHEWIEVTFRWGSWIECKCGYRPESQEDMDSHILSPPPKPENELKDSTEYHLGRASVYREMADSYRRSWEESFSTNDVILADTYEDLYKKEMEKANG